AHKAWSNKYLDPKTSQEEKRHLWSLRGLPFIGAQVGLSAYEDEARFYLFDKKEAPGGYLNAYVSQDTSVLQLSDHKGTSAVLGNAQLSTPATGSVEQRPASSLVLFDKDGKVIWKIP